MSAAESAPAKKAAEKPAKPKKPAAHPPYSNMIRDAITALKERNGSSRQAIAKYIEANFKVQNVNVHLKVALKNGVKSGALKQPKGKGASGSFKLGASATQKKPKVKKTKVAKKPKAAKKPKTKKPAGEKKPKAKKPKAKKAKKPAAAKPKKVKSPKKTKKPAAKKVKAKTPKKPAAKK